VTVDSSQLAPLNVSALLKKYGIRPSKGLGQNFLVDETALRKVVQAAEISEGDVVLEVGPGLGSLTRYLSAESQRVIAVELDKKLLPVLHETLAPFDNVEIIVNDILELDLGKILESFQSPAASSQTIRQYKVVANIPYYITSALIRHLLEAKIKPSTMVLTVQKEVAQRICEYPPNLSLLALSVQVYGQPQIAAKIPAGAFYPPPKVDSSIVKIDLFPEPKIPNPLLPMFFRLAKAGFSQKRKMLRNTLSVGMGWSKDEAVAVLTAAEIDSQRRAQTLSMIEWESLTKSATQWDVDNKG